MVIVLTNDTRSLEWFSVFHATAQLQTFSYVQQNNKESLSVFGKINKSYDHQIKFFKLGGFIFQVSYPIKWFYQPS